MTPFVGILLRPVRLLRRKARQHPIIAVWTVIALSIIGAMLALMLKGNSVRLQWFRDSLWEQEGIFLEGHIYGIDIDNRTIDASWVIGGCGSYALNHSDQIVVGGGCRMVNRRIDIYVGGGTTQNDSTVWSYDPSLHPIDTKTGEALYIQGLNEFQTSQLIDIGSARILGEDWTQQHAYPFDFYWWRTSLVFVNPQNISEDIPLIHVTPTDLTDNFVPSVSSEVPINQTLVTLDGSVRTLAGRKVNVRLDRNATTKTFVMMIFFINWGLTIVVLHITVLSLVSKDVRLLEGVVILPVTVILTIPALRALFPESPPFGIFIDNIGLFLQMILVSISSIVLLVNSIHFRTTKDSGHQGSYRSMDLAKVQTRLSGGAIQTQTYSAELPHAADAQAPEEERQSGYRP
ncbi:hypothetical protein FRC04_009261 [Tulasnella sp. 424]|nr:hypothetical protein FRC04_009261 [Tulasnella sp. 424]